jgi:predicted DNA-binding transcriptional regulator YafY
LQKIEYMAVNKAAKLRYRILDHCFRQCPEKGMTLDDLLTTVNRKLRDEQHLQISLRTLQSDLNDMKSQEVGFAPIESRREGRQTYFYYTDKNFSILKSPVSENDKIILQEAAQLLKQFEGLPHFEALEETLLRINCLVDTSENSLIQFEESDYHGREYIAPIYEAIKKNKVLLIDYQEFNNENIITKTISPYFLKEFRNRWYVVGQVEKGKIYNLALDRILKIVPLSFQALLPYPEGFSPTTHFRDIIGVTLLKDSLLETIRFKVSPQTTPYLKTKKLHPSQQELETDKDGWTIFEIQIRQNYELLAEFRRLGGALEVLSPASLRDTMKVEFEALAKRYV